MSEWRSGVDQRRRPDSAGKGSLGLAVLAVLLLAFFWPLAMAVALAALIIGIRAGGQAQAAAVAGMVVAGVVLVGGLGFAVLPVIAERQMPTLIEEVEPEVAASIRSGIEAQFSCRGLVGEVTVHRAVMRLGRREVPAVVAGQINGVEASVTVDGRPFRTMFYAPLRAERPTGSWMPAGAHPELPSYYDEIAEACGGPPAPR